MPGLLLIHTVIALLSSCDALRLDSSQRVTPPDLFQDDRPALLHLIQELVRTRRHVVQELVRVQPHLVHDMSRPEVQEISRSQAQMKAVANSSGADEPSAASVSQGEARPSAVATAMDDNMDVEDEMERMVHLVSPQDSERYIGQSDLSQEASGFYGTDMEDRDRGEEGGDERERRGGGEEEWEREAGEDTERTGGDGRGEEERGEGEADDGEASELGHLSPDLDTLIGYSPSSHPPSSVQPDHSSPAEMNEPGPQEHRSPAVLEVGASEREPWEAEGEEDVLSSGYGLVHSSVSTTSVATSAAPSTSPSTLPAEGAGGVEAVDTAAPETDTDSGLWGSFTKDEKDRKEDEDLNGSFKQNPTVADVGVVPSKEPLQPGVEGDEETGEEELDVKRVGLQDNSEEDEMWRKTDSEETRTRHLVPLTTDSSLTAGFTDSSSDWLDKTTAVQAKRPKVGGSKLMTDEMKEAQQVVCLDWKELVGRGYVILNMTQNLNCEEFRVDRGVRLLKIMEHVFARRMNSPEGSWVLYLSKPTHQQHQLLMNVASERGVIATSDVLDMLGEIRKSLNKVGIQNYSATSRCHSQPSQTRSDYGKLFVVLVIIGSICMVIITSGFIYICWQRRLPATKTMFRAEELHFVENGCHDNPMLDVTNDSQPEMQEKKPSTNGLTGAGDRGKEDSSRWQVFVNQGATEEEEEEQDTHL